MNILLWILFGALVGWIASLVTGESRGLLANIALGIIGAIVGGFIAGLLNIGTVNGFDITSLLIALTGAVLINFIFIGARKKT